MIGEVFQSTRDGAVTVVKYEGSKRITVQWANTGNTSVVQLQALRDGLIRDRQLILQRKEVEAERSREHAAKLAAAAIKRQQDAVALEERKAAAEGKKALEQAAKEAARTERAARVAAAKAIRQAKALATCDLSAIELDESKPRKGVLEFDFKDRNGKWVLRFRDLTTKAFVQTRLGKLHNNVTQRARNGGSVQEVYNTTYSGVGLSESFADAQKFCDWVVQQPGWGLGWQLDKDLLAGPERQYSEDNCVFLPRRLNHAIAVTKDAKGVARLAEAYKDALDPRAYGALKVWQPR